MLFIRYTVSGKIIRFKSLTRIWITNYYIQQDQRKQTTPYLNRQLGYYFDKYKNCKSLQ